MKVKAVMIVFFLLLLAGCQEKTVKELLEDAFSQSMEVIEIVDTNEWEDKKLVIYLADVSQDSKWVYISLLQKENGDWNVTTSTGYSLSNQNLYARHSSWITKDTNELGVIYGMVNDSDIHSIKVKKENGFEEIPIHESKWGRVFYSPNSWGPVKALDSEGNVIHEEDFL
ncbi:hypothetical protein [Halobacillus yeomjeoni]|uniref:Lipoprotein n=1 Tax=Halobacillus yeomjeoni TaxID=311194 RepID=A0A931MWB6_9BACI|nr:hypothetical protein [Halobacillus yeomjeoni]MBH0231420.1 hypothetical protein [Halobacillus yeomjeoni]